VTGAMSSTGSNAGRVAVVTGARRGIGAAVVRALADGGARVAVLDLEEPTADAASAGAPFVRCDVSDPGSVDAAFGQVEAELGPVSILVNNAGVLRSTSVEELPLADWNLMLAVNLTGALLCCQRVLPGMRDAGYGRILCIGSSAGKTGGAHRLAGYGASKAGMMALAKAIGTDYAPYGITSNAIAPAAIDTDMIADLAVSPDGIPVGRLGRPEDVAAAAAFLCSPAAGYVTAEVMDVNGGFLVD
jgi:NAD(P)-dependent dehydrogenase (short-subunit alcohol dehydrogenase family)